MACVKREQRNDPFQNFENKETELDDKWGKKRMRMHAHAHTRARAHAHTHTHTQKV